MENGATLTELRHRGRHRRHGRQRRHRHDHQRRCLELGLQRTTAAALASATCGSEVSLLVLNGGTVNDRVARHLPEQRRHDDVFGGIGVAQTSLGATGTIVVSGPGSELTNDGGMAIGKTGPGLLSILNGGNGDRGRLSAAASATAPASFRAPRARSSWAARAQTAALNFADGIRQCDRGRRPDDRQRLPGHAGLSRTTARSISTAPVT